MPSPGFLLQRFGEFSLRGEVIGEIPGGDSGGFRDLGDGRRGIALLVEEFEAGFKNAFAGRLVIGHGRVSLRRG